MPRGRRPKEVESTLRKDVFKRPDFVDKMPSRGQRGREIALLSEKIRIMQSDEAVVHTVIDFMERFAVKEEKIKAVLAYIKTQLKIVYNINHPRVHWDRDSGRIYFWSKKLNAKGERNDKSND